MVPFFFLTPPQAFSHFTFERSGHQLIVVDIQGVGDLYTDPQIHTEKGTDFGDGNLGRRGTPARFHGEHTPLPQISQLFVHLRQTGPGGVWAKPRLERGAWDL